MRPDKLSDGDKENECDRGRNYMSTENITPCDDNSERDSLLIYIYIEREKGDRGN